MEMEHSKPEDVQHIEEFEVEFDMSIFENEGKAPINNQAHVNNIEKMLAPKDAGVIIERSQDHMEATILITPPENGGAPLNPKQILETLQSKGIVYGIDMTMLKELMASPVYNEKIVIARGTPPIHGENGALKYAVKIEGRQAPKINEDGSVDFQNLELIQQVQRGQVLCKKTDATEGMPGKTVTGRVLMQTKGKPKALPAGNNTVVSPDGTKLVALRPGRLVILSDRICISDNYEIHEDINLSTGNINFDGHVSINGNVTSGYEVKATGDITISGVVEGALIEAGGNITVKGGVIGGSKGATVTCKGDLKCKFMENSTIMIQGNIWTEAIVRCEVGCGEELVATDIVGGNIVTGSNINARVCGSSAYTKTKLDSGTNPFLAKMEERLIMEMAATRKQMTEIDRIKMVLEELAKESRLDEEKASMLENLRFSNISNQNLLAAIQEELSGINQKKWSKFVPTVKFSKKVYPGVSVKIKDATYNVQTESNGKTFIFKDDEIFAR